MMYHERDKEKKLGKFSGLAPEREQTCISTPDMLSVFPVAMPQTPFKELGVMSVGRT